MGDTEVLEEGPGRLMEGKEEGAEAFLRQPQQEQHGGKGRVHEPVGHLPVREGLEPRGRLVGF